MPRQLELPLCEVNLGPSEVSDFASALPGQNEQLYDRAVVIGLASVPNCQ
jgi:hypothetical protein